MQRKFFSGQRRLEEIFRKITRAKSNGHVIKRKNAFEERRAKFGCFAAHFKEEQNNNVNIFGKFLIEKKETCVFVWLQAILRNKAEEIHCGSAFSTNPHFKLHFWFVHLESYSLYKVNGLK